MTRATLRLTVLFAFALSLLAPAVSAAPLPLQLDFLGRTPAGGQETAEIAAFDPVSKRVFATDATNNRFGIYDFSNPSAPLPVTQVDLSPWGAGPNSVAYLRRFGRVVAVGTNGDTQLGRLTVTTTLGDADADGDYEQLYAFGGRSMSLLDPSGQMVFDTGDQLEQLSASLDSANFNKDNEPSKIDNRSDNKGPEPEGIATGVVGGHTYAFLGAERSGMIHAFDLSSSPGKAELAGWINTRDADLGPEGLEFVPAWESPTKEAMLLVTNEVSGTVSAYGATP